MHRRRSRWTARAAAALTLVLVAGAGVVGAAPAQAEQAPALGSGLEALGPSPSLDSTWRDLLDVAVGDAGSALGLEIGSFNFASIIGGPLISSLFGSGPSKPGISDVLSRIDDLEGRIDEVQSSLDTIEADVLKVDVDVLMGSCDTQTSRLTDYVASVALAQEDYTKIVDEVENLRTGRSTDPETLKIYIDRFILYTTGEANPYAVNDSKFAQLIANVHGSMVKTAGNAGVITDCGKAFFTQWQAAQTPAALAAAPASTAGVWLDDSQYYAPIEQMSRYWQSVQLQSMFLLQQASIMQASKLYTANGGILPTDETQTVCILAHSTSGMATAKAVCDSGLATSTKVYANVTAEWRQIGRPLTTDEVVMSLGSDVTNRAVNGIRSTSTLWAREPTIVHAPWGTGTPTTESAPVSYGGYPGFVAAGADQWRDLDLGYQASHTSVKPAASGLYDLLGTMSSVTLPNSVEGQFDASFIDYVWIPNATTTADQQPEGNRRSPGLVVQEGAASSDTLGYYDDSGFSIRCMVAPIDGRICDPGTADKFWKHIQTGRWVEGQQSVFTMTPSSSKVPPLVVKMKAANTRCYQYADNRYACGHEVEMLQPLNGSSVNWKTPTWLAEWSGAVGRFDNPFQEATLWPAAPVPSCSGGGNLTSWGPPTQCLDLVNTWIQANIPNPSEVGPVPTESIDVELADLGRTAACTVPEWEPTSETAGRIVDIGDVTWTGTDSQGGTHTETAPMAAGLVIDDFVYRAAWPAPQHITLSCSYTAHYRGYAKQTDLESGSVLLTRQGGSWHEGFSTGGTTPEPTPSGSGAAPVGPSGGVTEAVAPVAASPSSARGGRLAATGTDALGMLAAGSVLALLGAALVGRTTFRRGLQRRGR